MSDLFEIPESLSPRLAFLRQHDLTLRKVRDDRYECALDDETFGVGDTGDTAVIDFCLKTKLPHYSTP